LTHATFATMDLQPEVAQGIEDAGFEQCTPIQAETLPIALAGNDVAGQAQTGTGKTAAFLIATFNWLLQRPRDDRGSPHDPRALILAPTRELAVQIHKDAELLGRHTGFRLGLAFGGTDYDKQRRQLADGVDILIGTPGRIIDYFKQRVFSFRGIQVAVLDEADRMFDLGFIKDIRFVFRRMPPPEDRLNLLFSATLSHRVLELAYEHMNDPELVRIEPEQVTAERVRQVIYYPANEEKLPLLVGLLKSMDARRTMVFVNTKREADRLQDYLNANGIEAMAISGDVPQKKRLRMLTAFQSGDLPVLIGTDVASRGLHIEGVSHVFNYDLPEDAEDYVHRIGRTARAGASGDAISFGCERYAMGLPDIEAYIGMKIPVAAVEDHMLPKVERPRHAGRRRPEDRAGGGRRPDGGGRGRPRQGRRAPGPAKAPAAAPEPAPARQADGDGNDGAPAKKRRRRRRRKPAGGDGEASPSAPRGEGGDQ
jgi:ATP-dependent RNA helicase RhlB